MSAIIPENPFRFVVEDKTVIICDSCKELKKACQCEHFVAVKVDRQIAELWERISRSIIK